jgi:hypothetical protein
MEDRIMENVEQSPSLYVDAPEKVVRKPHPALIAGVSLAICAVVGVGAFLGINTLNKPAAPAEKPPIVHGDAADKDALMPVVTDESGEIVSDEGISVNVEVFEGEVPAEGGNVVK